MVLQFLFFLRDSENDLYHWTSVNDRLVNQITLTAVLVDDRHQLITTGAVLCFIFFFCFVFFCVKSLPRALLASVTQIET